MVLRKVEGASGGGGWIGPGSEEGRKMVFTREETGRSNSCARIARLGRREARERERRREKEDEDALKTELARNEIIILRWIERERGSKFFGTRRRRGKSGLRGTGEGDREVIRTGGG